MHVNQKASESLAMLASIDPVSTSTTVTSGWVSVANLHQLLAVITTGVLGASATVDAKLQQATDNSGTGAKDITGKAITQIVKASGDNKTALINARAADLDTNGGFGFVQLSITVGTAASLVTGQLYATTRYEDAATLNPTRVVQVV